MALDAFGRLRTSGVFNLFEYAPNAGSTAALTGIDEDTWVSTNEGSATTTYDSAANNVSMTITAGADTVTRETKLPIPYQPGKSRLFMFSVVPVSRARGASEDYVARTGVFSTTGSAPVVPDEGHWLETDASDNWFVYKYTGVDVATSGSRIIQSSWNIDTFDGNGPSGKTITGSSMTGALLLVLDQEYLGVGQVRMGFNIDGITYYGHRFTPTDYGYCPYTTTPRLPITYQLDGGTTTSSNVVMKQVCCTCISEGGYTPIGRRVAIGTAHDGARITSPDTKYIILGIKIGSAYPTGSFSVISANVVFPEGGSSQWCDFEFQVHSTVGSVGAVSSAPSFTAQSNNILEVWQGNTASTNPTITTDGYITHMQTVVQKSDTEINHSDYSNQLKRIQLSQYDTLYVTAQTSGTGNNKNVAVNLEIVTFA